MDADFVARLSSAGIGATFNQYAASPLRQERLRRYLEARADAQVVLVGEAAGYRGARVSGLAFTGTATSNRPPTRSEVVTSERQLTVPRRDPARSRGNRRRPYRRSRHWS